MSSSIGFERLTDGLVDELRQTLRERAAEYGNGEDSCAHIAAMWQRYQNETNDCPVVVAARDVPAMMIQLKLARLAHDADSKDNWLDIAGYAILGAAITADLREGQHEFN